MAIHIELLRSSGSSLLITDFICRNLYLATS